MAAPTKNAEKKSTKKKTEVVIENKKEETAPGNDGPAPEVPGTQTSVVPLHEMPQHLQPTDEYKDAEKRELIRKLYFANCPDDTQIQHCMYVGEKSGLSYLARQIYAIPRSMKKGNQWIDVLSPQTSIDGYRLIAERTGALAGIDDALFPEGWLEEEYQKDEWGGGQERSKKTVTKKYKRPVKATVTVWKIVQGNRVPFTASARWEEYFPGVKQGAMWIKMPYGQLSKCAEALALRKGFPNNLSGLYTAEEMERSDAIQVEASTAAAVALNQRIGAGMPEGDGPPPPPAPAAPDPLTVPYSKYMEDLNESKDLARTQAIFATAKKRTDLLNENKAGISVCYVNSIARLKGVVVQGDPEKTGSVLMTASLQAVATIVYGADGWVTLVPVPPAAGSPPPAAPSAPAPVSPSTSGGQAGSKPVTSPGTAASAPSPITGDQLQRLSDIIAAKQIPDATVRKLAQEYFKTPILAGLTREQAEEMVDLLNEQGTTGADAAAEVFGAAPVVPITDKQVKHIHTLKTKIKLEDVVYRGILQGFFGDQITSSKQITEAQAEQVIAYLYTTYKIPKLNEEIPPPDSQF